MSYPFRSATASVTVTVIRNAATPTFINIGNYDVTVSEGQTVLAEILNVTARDTDEGINGIVRYSINPNQAAANIFGINSVSGTVFARVSLLEVSEDIYTVMYLLQTLLYNCLYLPVQSNL